MRQARQDRLYVAFGARTQDMELQPQRAGRRLLISHSGFSIGVRRVDEQCYVVCRRHQLVQQLHPFRPELRDQGGHARDISARSVQARDKPRPDRVDPQRENDRNRRARRLCGQCRKSAAGRKDHSHRTTDQLGRQLRQSLVSPFRPAVFDQDIAALDIACFKP